MRPHRRASQWPPATVFALTPWLWVAFACLFFTIVIGDSLTSLLALQSGSTEGNPLAALALHFGFLGLVGFKILGLFILYLLTLLALRRANPTSYRRYVWFLFACSALYALIIASNLLAFTSGSDLYHWFLP